MGVLPRPECCFDWEGFWADQLKQNILQLTEIEPGAGMESVQQQRCQAAYFKLIGGEDMWNQEPPLHCSTELGYRDQDVGISECS